MSLAIGWRRTLVKLVAAAIVLALYGFARPPRLAGSERAEMAARFRFEPSPLPELSGPRRTIRRVHPSYDHLSAWISAVGAAVALNDLDGDGLPNDLCLVDPRFDRAIVAPMPGTGSLRAAVRRAPVRPRDHGADGLHGRRLERGRTRGPVDLIFGNYFQDGARMLDVHAT